MLAYAEKLTLSPASVSEDDIAALRSAGHSDGDILQIAEVIGYYAYVNRIASGLGVEVEGWIAE